MMHMSKIEHQNKRVVGILGCGWLGTALAKKQIVLGDTVRGSRRTKQGVLELNRMGVEGFQLKIDETTLSGDLDFFVGLDLLVIALPPGLRRHPTADFVSKIKHLIPLLNTYPPSKILFTSSISVYGSAVGQVSENTLPKPETHNGKQLLKVEQLLLKHFPDKTTIVRLGGLIGQDRHPIHQLSKKKIIPQGDALINLIHQTDAVAAILRLLPLTSPIGIYNLVTPFHPTKKEYYTTIAKQWGVKAPDFSDESTDTKQISSQRLIDDFDFVFQVDKLLIE